MNTLLLTPIRRHDIDWLKVLATFSLILFQAVRISFPGMAGGPGTRVLSFDLPSVFFLISQWYIPLAFLVPGWSRKSPLQHQTGKGSVRERFIRLGVPFLTGVLVLCPITRYVELGSLRGGPHGARPPAPASFPVFLLDFFTRQDAFSWYNLWFLFYLFIFSVISWPIFSRLLGKKVTPMKTSPGWVYLPLVPLALMQLAGDGFGLPRPHEGWAGPATFLAYFILGFIISRYSAYERVLHQEAVRAGVLGVSLLATLTIFSAYLPVEVLRAGTAAGGWLIVVGILGLGKRYLDRPSGALAYLRKSTLPVFLLHHVPLVIFGTAMTASPVNGWLKLVVLLAVTLGTTLPLYHFLVRRSALLRLLFGMKGEDEHAESWKDQVMHRDRG